MGWFAHPLLSENGGYPDVMVETINENSLKEKRSISRLPLMTNVTKRFIKGTADFLGLNYYTSRIVELADAPSGLQPSIEYDSRLKLSVDKAWPKSISNWLYSVPIGIRGILNWIRDNYNNSEVMITENGWSDSGDLKDTGRVNYLKVSARV